MAFANFNVSLKAILTNQEGKVLALEAHKNGPMADYFDLPGGRIDDSEVGTSFIEILRRELLEEVGDINYEIDPSPRVAISWLWPEGQAMVFIYYEVKFNSGEIKISDEHLSLEWISLNEESIDKYFTTYHNKALKDYTKLI